MTGNLKEQIGILQVSHLIRWVRSVTTGHYTVKFDHRADTAYVDYRSKVIVVPQPNAAMTIRDAVRLRGFCIHETSHPRYQPRLGEVMEANPVKENSPLGAIYNLFLDVHAESMRAEEFPGDAKALSEFGAVTGADCYERMQKALKDTGGVWPKGFEKLAAVLTACRNAEGSWNIGMMLGFQKLIDLYPQEAKDLADQLEAKFNLTERLATNPQGEDEYTIWDLSKEVYEFLYGKDPESQMEKPPEKGGGGKSKPENGKPENGKPEGGKEEQQSSAPGNEYDPNAEGDSDEQAHEKIKVTELLFSEPYGAKGKGKGHGMGFDFTNYRQNDLVKPIDPALIKIIDYSKER